MPRQYCFIVTVFILLIAGACNPRNLPVVRDVGKSLDERASQEAERLLRENPRWREVGDVCLNLGNPENAALVSKRLANNSLAVSLDYQCPLRPNEIYRFYENQFRGDGWVPHPDNRLPGESSLHDIFHYRKDNLRVSLQIGGMGPGLTYGIWCEKVNTGDHQN